MPELPEALVVVWLHSDIGTGLHNHYEEGQLINALSPITMVFTFLWYSMTTFLIEDGVARTMKRKMNSNCVYSKYD